MGKNKNKLKIAIKRMQAARKAAQLEQAAQEASTSAAGASGSDPAESEGNMEPPAARGRDLKKTRRGLIKGRSKSAPPTPNSCEALDVNSRYWSLIVGDLKNTVSELYVGCQSLHDIARSREVLAELERYRQNFSNLMDKFTQKFQGLKPPPAEPSK